jgi:hypothetical protein
MPSIGFDLHGLVSIRLVDPTPLEAAGVGQQLGLSPSALVREPEIIIRWVDDLQISSLHVIGDHEAGYNHDAFFLLRGKHQARCRVQIPFESIGRRCEIVCESGVTGVPLLVPIINLTLLAKSVVPIHASAFVYQGRGILAAGWSKGGKTEALLSFMARGAEFVADDWVYVTPEGRLYGMAEPVRLRAWHLDDLPRFRRRLPLLARARLRVLHLADRWKDALPVRSRLLPARPIGRLLHLLARQAFVTVPPRRLFESQVAKEPPSFDHLFLLASHESSEIRVEPVDPVEVARQMVFSVQEERDRFLSYYRKFRFAFPGRANPLIDESERLQRELLIKALAGKTAHAVFHPYPLRIPSLFESMHSVIESTARQADSGSWTSTPAVEVHSPSRQLAAVEA